MPKMNRRLGSLTASRSAAPSSPGFARNFMNFRFNMLGLRNTLPNVLGRGSDSGVNWSPRNTSGSPCVYGGTGNAPGQNAPAGPSNEPGAVKVNED